ncbi:uncharacterized protein MONOS_383 [Monocercomonoides exilis]|uniref:uncharacterized protein n=1 Tax=Monocercomonoides exilis TaxID=2049356 RepID=UPI0035595EC5|nr:hypothetical protein MONOS_383 [Monocercomonoides exilis]|eukprot:MONOS_383.1-p1 / transcript=MONOS_383.1 / gene=MONOS_383 / organism=Monocercomonoides_exilis_PA203 / gene_product=unspecified product / transcript_product=unspecified product / location=Mono_scaffold00006:150845-151213(-) / protein_length=123 / sequence_SO=supercontig / SO=protein_coding / is_pseudo=false
MSCLKKPFVGGATMQLPHRSVLLSSLSSSTVAALQSVSPSWRRRNKEKKAAGDDKSSSSLPSSSAPAVDPSDESSMAASHIKHIKLHHNVRWLRIDVPKAAGLLSLPLLQSLQSLQSLLLAL